MKNSTFRTNGSLFAFFTACTLLGCTSDPATAEMLDMSTGTDAGVVETPLVNASLYNTVLGRPTDSSIAISVSSGRKSGRSSVR